MQCIAQDLRQTRIGSPCSPDEAGPGVSEAAGFTLIELMMVIAMLGILSGIGTMNYVGYIEKARIVKATTEMQMLEREIEAYQVANGSLPNTLADLGLKDLKDPWGNPYQFLNFDTIKGGGVGEKRKDRWNNPLNLDYDLYSMGPDGLSQTALTAAQSRDDIVRANSGEYFGPASDY